MQALRRHGKEDLGRLLIDTCVLYRHKGLSLGTATYVMSALGSRDRTPKFLYIELSLSVFQGNVSASLEVIVVMSHYKGIFSVFFFFPHIADNLGRA